MHDLRSKFRYGGQRFNDIFIQTSHSLNAPVASSYGEASTVCSRLETVAFRPHTFSSHLRAKLISKKRIVLILARRIGEKVVIDSRIRVICHSIARRADDRSVRPYGA